MTFNIKGWGNVLAVLGNASGNAGGRNVAYTYITNDTVAEAIAADYFLTMYKTLKAGDIILIVCDIDGTPDFDFVQVTASTSSTVTTRRKTDAVIGDQTLIADAADAGLSTSNTYSDAAVNTAIQVNTDKINAILALLVSSGLMASS